MSHRIKQLTQTEISVFCQQIAMVVTSGLPTYYGISILRDEVLTRKLPLYSTRFTSLWKKAHRCMKPCVLPDVSLNIWYI